MPIYYGNKKITLSNIKSAFLGNVQVYSSFIPPIAKTTPTAGKTYITNISALTAEQIHLISYAISNNAEITSNTYIVYIDWGDLFIKLSCEKNTYTTKSMTIDGDNHNFVIIGFNHDTLTTPTYYGAATATGKAGITWQTRNCLNTKRQMNSSNTNVGGWTSCAMRTSIMVTLFNGFGFKDAVAPVNKLTSAGNMSSIINTDSDKLFLLSEVEIFGETAEAMTGEGTQYAWYKAGNPKYKRGPENIDNWWERSPKSNSKLYFCNISESGTADFELATAALCIAVCFCS